MENNFTPTVTISLKDYEGKKKRIAKLEEELTATKDRVREYVNRVISDGGRILDKSLLIPIQELEDLALTNKGVENIIAESRAYRDKYQ